MCARKSDVQRRRTEALHASAPLAWPAGVRVRAQAHGHRGVRYLAGLAQATLEVVAGGALDLRPTEKADHEGGVSVHCGVIVRRAFAHKNYLVA